MSRLEEVEGAALSAVVEERQPAAERATPAARQALEATEARGAARQDAEEAAAGSQADTKRTGRRGWPGEPRPSAKPRRHERPRGGRSPRKGEPSWSPYGPTSPPARAPATTPP